ncbi:MAG: RNA polymerase sigma factor [Oligosphaeraceae bacterium]
MEWEATSCSMLSGIGRNDPDAWQHFYDRYKVLVFLRGRRYGFSPMDLDDLLSRVMGKCFSATGGAGKAVLSFNPAKGRFRDYFCRIVNNEAVTMLRERGRRREVQGTLPDGKERDFPDLREKDSLEAEYRLCLVHEAFEQLKKELPPRQVQAFMAVRMDQVHARKVAQLQGTSLATVYQDIATVTEAIRRRVAQLEEE